MSLIIIKDKDTVNTIAMNTKTYNLKSSSLYWQGLFIWGLATIFYFFDNLLNVSPAAMKPQLSQAFNLSASELGLLSSCYLWPYAIMQIPAGLLMDRVGPRKLLTAASLCCASGAMVFGFADTLLLACFSRALIGIGASFAVVGCAKIASVWFPAHRFALFMGLMVAVGMLGPVVGLATVNSIVQTFGWREAMIGAGVIAFMISLLLWMLIRDKPAALQNSMNLDANQEPVFKGLREVAGCSQVWLVSIYAGLMFVPTLSFGGLWGIPYLVEAHGFSQESGGVLASLVFVGWVFGGPIYGWISDHMGKRNPGMYFANITTLLVSLAIIYTNNLSYLLAGVLMFALGLFSSGFIIAFAVTREKNRPAVSGTAIGFINTLNTLSVALLQWLIGKILDWVTVDAVISESGKLFSLGDYRKALMAIPICLLISLFTLLPIKETFCIPKKQ